MKPPKQYKMPWMKTASETSNRAAGGRLAKASGHWFEKALEESNALYRLAGLASIARCHPPTAGMPGAMRIVGAGPVDFLGTIKGGRSLVFDAKVRTGAASFAYDQRDHHQIEQLVDAQALGAHAFVLLCDPDLDVAYVLTGARLTELKRGDRIALRSRGTMAALSVPLVPVVPKRTVPYRHGRPVIWDYLTLFGL